jgi:hypothetical protein
MLQAQKRWYTTDKKCCSIENSVRLMMITYE